MTGFQRRLALWMAVLGLAFPVAAFAGPFGSDESDKSDQPADQTEESGADEPEGEVLSEQEQKSKDAATDEDLVKLRDEMLGVPKMDELFGKLIGRVNKVATEKAGLPSWRSDIERLYSDELVYYRSQAYGPLFDNKETLTYLRRLARTPVSGWSTNQLTAALILADEATAKDLDAIVDGYRASIGKVRFASSYPRQVGRAIRALSDATDKASQDAVSRAFKALRENLDAEEAKTVGGALEGLLRAGETEEAYAKLEELMTANEPGRLITVLNNAYRGLIMDGIDPDFKAKALDVALIEAQDILEGSSYRPKFTMGISTETQLFRDAVNFMAQVGDESSIDFLLECCTDYRANVRLGMDELQRLRYSLIRIRNQSSPESREKIDDMYAQALLGTAERLFSLDEEPMDAGEYYEFKQLRNLRYNAAMYYADLWDRHEDLRSRWADDTDVIELLATLVMADDETADGFGDDKTYYSVREKVETRILSAQILAKMRRDYGAEIESLDFYQEVLRVIINELGIVGSLTKGPLPEPTRNGVFTTDLTLDVSRKPSDTFVYDRAKAALDAWGYGVAEKDKRLSIAIEKPKKDDKKEDEGRRGGRRGRRGAN